MDIETILRLQKLYPRGMNIFFLYMDSMRKHRYEDFTDLIVEDFMKAIKVINYTFEDIIKFIDFHYDVFYPFVYSFMKGNEYD